jgi:hypothetical protein
VVLFPAQWANAFQFEWALRNSCGPHDQGAFEVTFEFPAGCNVMVDAAIRLLSLVNQLASTTRRVRLNFEEGEAGTMGCLNRMGFLDHLADHVEVLPSRRTPKQSRVRRRAFPLKRRGAVTGRLLIKRGNPYESFFDQFDQAGVDFCPCAILDDEALPLAGASNAIAGRLDLAGAWRLSGEQISNMGVIAGSDAGPVRELPETASFRAFTLFMSTPTAPPIVEP